MRGTFGLSSCLTCLSMATGSGGTAGSVVADLVANKPNKAAMINMVFLSMGLTLEKLKEF
jgi:hypothetical protein